MKNYKRIYATVNLDAVKFNMESMRNNISEDTGIIGVVKADGYGHGSVPVAKAIDKYVGGYAAATIEEGITLRKHGIEKPVLILGPVHESWYYDAVVNDISLPVFQYESAVRLSDEAVRQGKKARVHIAVDTGMSRIGCQPDEKAADMVQEISKLGGIELRGIFTHFAKADEADKEAADMQLKLYMGFCKMLEERKIKIPVKHCSNSAGIIDLKRANLNMVRAGISIYGLYPSDEVNKKMVALKPAMELKSYITYIKKIQPGTKVSYGWTFCAEKETVVATVPVGYGDGYPRSLSNRGCVLIRGKRAKIIGRICMDQMMVDVTDICDAAENDEVTLLGKDGKEEISVEEIAQACGGFHYELVCNIGKRVPRVYIENGEVTGTKDYFDDIYEDFQ